MNESRARKESVCPYFLGLRQARFCFPHMWTAEVLNGHHGITVIEESSLAEARGRCDVPLPEM